MIRKINQYLPKVAKIADLENVHLSYSVALQTFASTLNDNEFSSIIIGSLLVHRQHKLMFLFFGFLSILNSVVCLAITPVKSNHNLDKF